MIGHSLRGAARGSWPDRAEWSKPARERHSSPRGRALQTAGRAHKSISASSRKRAVEEQAPLTNPSAAPLRLWADRFSRPHSGKTFSTLRTLSAFLVGEQAEKRRCGQDADRMQIESAPPFVRSARQVLRLGRSLRLCNRLVASAVGLRSRGLGATPAGTSSSDPPVLRTDGCHRGSRQSPSAPGCAPSSSDAAGGRPSRTSCR